MVATRPLVERRGLHAKLAWLALVVLAGSAVRLMTIGEPDWAVFVVILIGVALVPSVIERDPTVTMPGELLVPLSVLVLLRAMGFVTAATPFFVMAGLALLVAIALDAYTSLELTPRFAVIFGIVTTMAFAAVWTVGTWVADLLFETNFVGGQTELMWDLVAATAAGVIAGVAFELYFRVSGRVERLDGSTDSEGSDDSEDSADAERGLQSTESQINLPGSDRQQRLAVHAMRTILALIAIVGLVRGNVGMFLNGLITVGVTFLPAVLRREYDYSMDVGLTMWVTIAVTLHAIGVLGPYRNLGWYDAVAHALSATVIAAIGYTVARAVELHTGAVRFRPAFRGVFVVLFVLAAGVAWELLEFASGGVAAVLGGRAALVQYGTTDIVKDLAFDAVGGVVVAVLITGRFGGFARTFANRIGSDARGRE